MSESKRQSRTWGKYVGRRYLAPKDLGVGQFCVWQRGRPFTVLGLFDERITPDLLVVLFDGPIPETATNGIWWAYTYELDMCTRIDMEGGTRDE